MSKRNLIILICSLCVFALISLGAIGFGTYKYFEHQKAPYQKSLKIYDTETYFDASYNDKYKIIRLDVTIDEVLGDWQIDSLEKKEPNIKLICETKDKTIKKEYNLKDIKFKSGETLKGSLVLENSTLKDYTMLKDLLDGNVNVEVDKCLTLNTTERNKLQMDYYQKQSKAKEEENEKTTQQKAAPRPAPVPYRGNDSFLDNLFNF